ncbi:uncharacterized protein MICPUCDRAFT_64839 [Micromonas pusilla CCMP1545]|uniref:Predicted protein n=1 Tax=Micromonas pusilla (strain CCMP1545) TaxID=564608 RepID=C1ML60_MICPC|nr:uncharacterized protein MICPUCDRAFT_64839 [Micromonas pusilla CCMP1545]EEH59877.1 predicted protein [Micromonas pusilla CCMP1545]|eukprot:XP_003056501.1 predicted protein [Micromonas pusilla CCMP1545]
MSSCCIITSDRKPRGLRPRDIRAVAVPLNPKPQTYPPTTTSGGTTFFNILKLAATVSPPSRLGSRDAELAPTRTRNPKPN